MKFVALLAAYLIGSVDFAVIVARTRGVDIHSVGSGNPGASNVLRTLGKVAAAMVLVGDLTKGLMAAAFGFVTGRSVAWAMLAGLLAVIGHCYPVFYKFKGGKGVATAAGVVFWTMPVVSLVLAAVWTVIVRITKTASIASLTVVVLTLPGALWSGLRGAALWWLAAILALVAYRHRGNISRMVKGSEQRVTT